MTINLKAPELRELKPRIMVCGVGGAGGNAVNNMIASGLAGVDFIVANTDAQALTSSKAERIIQMGLQVTEGLGAGSQPEVGRASAEEAIEEIRDHLDRRAHGLRHRRHGRRHRHRRGPRHRPHRARHGHPDRRRRDQAVPVRGRAPHALADGGIEELHKAVDTLIVIPNQNLFRVANEKTTFADAFSMADQVLYSGVACITDLMVREGLINLDFADVRAIMRDMGKAMMGTGEASGDRRAILAAEAAIANPLLDEVSMKGAKGLLISITGGNDLTLYEVDEAASRIRQEVDEDANIILGATFDFEPRRHHPRLRGRHRHRQAGRRRRHERPAPRRSRRAHARPGRRPARPKPARPCARRRPRLRLKPISPSPRRSPSRSRPAPAPVEPTYAPQGSCAASAARLTKRLMRPRAPARPMRRIRAMCSVKRVQPQRLSGAGARRRSAASRPPSSRSSFRRRPNSLSARSACPRSRSFPSLRQALMRTRQAQQTVAAAPAPETRRRTLLERLATFGMSRAEEHAAGAPASAPRRAAAAGPPRLSPAPAQPVAGACRIRQAPAGAAPGGAPRRRTAAP